jgi:RNA polymerase sigma-70 factor (ECF subfamily)
LDAIQESYIKIFSKANSYSDSKGSLKSWMARIAVNECLQILRKQKRLVLLDISSTSLEPQSQEDVVAQLSATEIYNEVEKLPVGYRTVFNLYVVEGYSHKEIGEMLTITPSSSRSQLTRAKVILKKAIKKKTNSMSYEEVG